MIRVDVAQEQLDQLLDDLADVGKAVDLTPAIRQAARYFQSAAIQRIRRAAADADGSPFAPLSARYARQKARKVGQRPILVSSGRLIRSLSSGSERILEVRPDGFSYGTRVPYAGHHASGTSKMPRRDFISFGAADLERIEVMLLEHLVAQLAA